MKNQEIIKVDLTDFPDSEKSVQIPGKLYLADNLDEEDDNFDNFKPQTFPVQLTMSMCFICISGGAKFSIDLNERNIHSGQIALLLPGSFMQIKQFEAGSKLIVIGADTSMAIPSYDIKMGVELGQSIKEQPVFYTTEQEMNDAVDIYKRLKVIIKEDGYLFKEEVAKNYFNILKCNMLNKFIKEKREDSFAKPSNRKEELFFNFMQSIKENYLTNRSITFYADKLFVSPKYLSSVVHEVSGKYATEWINEFVVLEAKAMLRSKGTSIKDVSNKLNFANQSFFAKYFKQHTGYTPKEYRML